MGRTFKMRLATALCCSIGLLTPSVGAGQARLSTDGKQETSIMEAAARAATGIELQPNATGQRQRRGSRIGTGVGLIIAGGLLIALRGYWVDKTGDASGDVNTAVVWGGLAMMGGGGLAIAFADIQSPAAQPVQQPRGRSGVGVFATRRGGGIAKRITW